MICAKRMDCRERDQVTLIVGERTFQTTIGTLCSDSITPNYFNGLFEMRERHDTSPIFIDRDGKQIKPSHNSQLSVLSYSSLGDCFAILLKYLRTGEVVIPQEWTRTEQKMT